MERPEETRGTESGVNGYSYSGICLHIPQPKLPLEKEDQDLTLRPAALGTAHVEG